MNHERARSFVAVVLSTLTASIACGGADARAVHQPRIPERKIAIVVNGERLPPIPAPRIVSGRLLVPIVRIFGALGIPVTRSGKMLVAQAPHETIRLVRGSRRAFVDRHEIVLDVAPLELGGTTYVPLRFVTQTLSASVAYDARASAVRISSTLVRRETATERIGGALRISGNLTAIDTLSEPPSVTVSYHNSVRTIAVTSSARIVLQDVVARSEQRASLTDLHVGDAVVVTIDRDGSVRSIEDRFGSRIGKIAAVSPSALVLEDGQVLTPDRTTAIVLNGQLATLGDLRVGDTVTQRMNPDTGETREIIAVRPLPAAPAGAGTHAGGPSIASFTAEPLHPLRLGEKFTFTLKGTAGGTATFDLGGFLLGQPMREEEPGVYRATLAVGTGMNFAQAAVLGRLAYAGNIVTQQAVNKISAATIAPQVTDVAPQNGQIVNNSMPSIYATFDAPTELGIDPQTVVLKLNGKDVTGSVTRTSSFVTYTCSTPLPDGPVSVSVAVADFAGNETSRTWTFTIQTR